MSMTIKRVISKHLESNSFIVSQAGEAIIIDAGVEEDEISKHLDGEKVVAVLLTHGHYDHAVYAQDYARAFGCKIYAAEAIKEYLADSDKNYSEGHFKISNFSDFCFLNGDGKVKLGGFDVAYFSTPGHSKCGMSFLIGDTIFVGDLIFSQGTGRLDLYGGDKAQMVESLKKVQSLDFQILESGHGEPSTRAWQERNLKTFIRFLSR